MIYFKNKLFIDIKLQIYDRKLAGSIKRIRDN